MRGSKSTVPELDGHDRSRLGPEFVVIPYPARLVTSPPDFKFVLGTVKGWCAIGNRDVAGLGLNPAMFAATRQ